MVTRKDGNLRLLVLADFLEKLPDERFNFGHIVSRDWAGDQGLSCGATACALGWCPSIPEFRSLGISLFRDTARPTEIGIRLPDDDPCPGDSLKHSLEVAGRLFGLSDFGAEWLFMPNTPHDESDDDESPGSDASATEVATHIRRFVAERKA